jgi:hypothetical protein
LGDGQPSDERQRQRACGHVSGVEKLDAVADRGYFNSEQTRACEEAGITVTLPKPMTSNAKAEARFGKRDFRYVADEDVYVCPAGEKLSAAGSQRSRAAGSRCSEIYFSQYVENYSTKIESRKDPALS